MARAGIMCQGDACGECGHATALQIIHVNGETKTIADRPAGCCGENTKNSRTNPLINPSTDQLIN